MLNEEFSKYCEDHSISGAQKLLFQAAYKLHGIDGCDALRITLGDREIIDDENSTRRSKIIGDIKNMSEVHPVPEIRKRRVYQLNRLLGKGKERDGD